MEECFESLTPGCSLKKRGIQQIQEGQQIFPCVYLLAFLNLLEKFWRTVDFISRNTGELLILSRFRGESHTNPKRQLALLRFGLV